MARNSTAVSETVEVGAGPRKGAATPNRIALTQTAVDRLAPPKAGRVTYWDRNLPGFGLRVAAPRPGSKEGWKAWMPWAASTARR